MSKTQLIGVTLGDATGIGPELVVKSFQDEELRSKATWLIAGDRRILRQGETIAKQKLDVISINNIDEVVKKNGRIYFIDLQHLDPDSYQLGKLSAESGKVTGEALQYLVTLAKNGKITGIMYAPLNKEALHRGGHHFQDEMHFFASLFNQDSDFGEINKMEDLWVTRVTSHIALRDVAAHITKEKVAWTIRFANENLTKAGYSNPEIAVAALNPHAGDGGMLGTEEIEILKPEIEKAQKEGLNVRGPYPADTLFVRRNKEPFDCLVAMYHDQAQTGMKMLGFYKGVTISGGLPVALTTPAHGTAFDIAGKGIADPGATIEAMKMAIEL